MVFVTEHIVGDRIVAAVGEYVNVFASHGFVELDFAFAVGKTYLFNGKDIRKFLVLLVPEQFDVLIDEFSELGGALEYDQTQIAVV
jgi:hypothetical protein